MRSLWTALLGASLLILPSADALSQVPRATNLQGVLFDDEGEKVANGAHEVVFALYDAETGGEALWTESQTIETVDGVLSARLGAVNELNLEFETPYWVGVSLDGGSELSPRLALVSVPYSLRSASVEDGSISANALAPGSVTSTALASGAVSSSALAAGAVTSTAMSEGSITSDALAPGSVTSAAINDGAIATDKISTSGASNGQLLTVDGGSAGWRDPLDGGGGSNDDWNLTGNSGTTSNHFIGTTDFTLLEFRVNNNVAMRLLPTLQAPSIVTGPYNAIGPGVQGATIAGGGSTSVGNYINAHLGFVGGGLGNEVTAERATVGGGERNIADGEVSAITGGFSNQANGEGSVVAGGSFNVATGPHAVVVGGSSNGASGDRSTILGGYQNRASGTGSVAAGAGADAAHDGTFVWRSYLSSQQGLSKFKSTAARQFLIEAPGGFGVGTNNPVRAAHIKAGSAGVTSSVVTNDDLVVESGDAVVGIYSGPSGSFGSGLVLGQMTNGSFSNKWGIVRNTVSGGNHLRFTWGTNVDYSQNNTAVRFSPAGSVYADGAFSPGGADLAESVDVVGSVDTYEPGDVLVVSARADRTFELSSGPYATTVTGVYATKPGVLLSRYGTDGPVDTDVPMAVLGIVPTKVTSENGSIRHGDLLVTSSTPGHAMKADPEKLGFGMVLGKALQAFEGTGEGVIEVLVNVK